VWCLFFKYVCQLSIPVILLMGKKSLQDKTNSVIDLYKDILRAVEDLATCSYTIEAFSELLGRIQAAVCDFSIPFSSVLTCSLYIRLTD